jgi:hypothetical protein
LKTQKEYYLTYNYLEATVADYRLFAIILIDFKSTDSFIDSPGKASAIKHLVREHIRELLPSNVELVERQNASGFFALFLSVADAIQFAQDLQTSNPVVKVLFRTLIGVGDIISKSGSLEGEVCTVLQAISRKVPFDEIWFIESAYQTLQKEELPWEEIGVITLSAEMVSSTCYRLVLESQCFLPSTLKSTIAKDYHVVIDAKSEIDFRIKNNRHIIFLGFDYGTELNQIVSKLPGSIPSNQMWLVVNKLPQTDRENWLGQNRNLLIASDEAFQSALFDISQDDGEQQGNPESTMALTGNNITDSSISLIGLALPMVPMGQIIQGYSFDLLFDGSWGFSKNAQLRIEVTLNKQQVIPLKEGCILNSRPMEVNKPYPLGNGAMIKTNLQTYRFISGVGTHYVGIILGPDTRKMPLKVGDRIELGRQPSFPGFALPDRGGNDRISWMQGPSAEKAIANKLTLDRALTGRHHVVISQVEPFRYSISSMHDKLPSYLLRNNQAKLAKVRAETSILKEGILIVGTHILRIG